MSNRSCPACGNKVNLFKLLIMGPAKTYKCSFCNAAITVSTTSNRILIYGSLLFPAPAFLYFKVEPSIQSGSLVAGLLIILVTLIVVTQKVMHAKT